MKGVPLVAVSALTGEGLDRLMQAILDAYEVWNKRVPTAALNRWFEGAVEAHPPPAVSGRRLRLNYMTQAKSRPPSFVVFCTRADAVPDAYKRYLVNSPARDLRSARHADPPDAAREGQSVQGTGQAQALSRHHAGARNCRNLPARKSYSRPFSLQLGRHSGTIFSATIFRRRQRLRIDAGKRDPPSCACASAPD